MTSANRIFNLKYVERFLKVLKLVTFDLIQMHHHMKKIGHLFEVLL